VYVQKFGFGLKSIYWEMTLAVHKSKTTLRRPVMFKACQTLRYISGRVQRRSTNFLLENLLSKVI